jgi:predicted alpha-1,2-mannosidase
MKLQAVGRLALAMALASLAACGGGTDDSNAMFPIAPGGTTAVAPDTPPAASIPQEEPFVKRALASYVNTLRGANSNGDFTRGNTFPAVAVPFGFNFWTPVNRDDSNWFYQFYEDEANNRLLDRIMGFGVVHMPSPWIGNRQTMQIMPISKTDSKGVLITSKSGRSENFERKDEIAKAHYYSLAFKNGQRTEITPTDHAAYFRFTAPEKQQNMTVLFDLFDGGGSLQVDQAQKTISGKADYVGGKNAPPLFFHAVFDAEIAKVQGATTFPSWVQFDTQKTGKTIGMRIATSFISVEQAKDNLAQEIAGKSFDEVKQLAEAAWDDKLNTVQVDGASEDQKVTLYSNLYRSFLYPNSAWENVDGKAMYISPYDSSKPLKPGKIWVNNGFWDTYRTTWPLYTLLLPKEAGEMLDGFVNAYKDGGWVPRWSGPDYRDSMVATSSDVIFADAYLKGVRNFDSDAAYASMQRNASVYSSEGSKGRKGMEKSIFYGYTPTEIGIGDPAPGHVAWSLEGSLNDFGISQMAKALNKPDDDAYYGSRALNYANLFSSEASGTWAGGWFRSKNSAGAWNDNVGKSGNVTPYSWGYGYTEGNAWSYAFLTPQDGQGLANLHGGRAQLKAHLDDFFSAPTYLDGGSYGRVIHEVKEARKASELAKVGQYQHANQTVHHTIYMYNYAGVPSEGQKQLRDVMDKLYTSGLDKNGIPDGSGYIGDEDNGEQSAWYVFSAMGFYPVSMGRPEYAIGAPYFPKMVVSLQNGKRITISAPGVSDANRYVQSLRLNGQDITRSFLLHTEIADGATLEFVMGARASAWGTGENDVPTSITQGNAKPAPLLSLLPTTAYDVSSKTAAQLPSLFDRDSGTVWQSGVDGTWVEASLQAGQSPSVVKVYTLTSSNQDAAQDPKSWRLRASNDGTTWVTLDERKGERFPWRRQTRPFAIKNSTAAYAKYRLEIDGPTAVTVSEFELLAQAK